MNYTQAIHCTRGNTIFEESVTQDKGTTHIQQMELKAQISSPTVWITLLV
jgi:hypothetical protein